MIDLPKTRSLSLLTTEAVRPVKQSRRLWHSDIHQTTCRPQLTDVNADTNNIGLCFIHTPSLRQLAVASWDVDGWKVLCHWLETDKELHHLTLGDSRVDYFEDTMDTSLLVKALKRSGIRSLTFQGISLSPETAEELSSLKIPELRLHRVDTDPGSWGILLQMEVNKLLISSCDLGMGWSCSRMLRKDHPLYLLMRRQSLFHLEVVSCGLGNFEIITMALGAQLGLSSLQTLDFRDNDISTGLYLGQLVRHCRRSRKVNVSENALSSEAWNDFCISISHHKELEELRVQRSAAGVSSSCSSKILCHTVKTLPRLSLLDISEHAWGNKVDAACLVELCTHNSLRTLFLQGCRLDDIFLAKLLQKTQHSKLRTLDWSRNNLRTSNPDLQSALKDCNLERLNLSLCGISNSVISELAGPICASRVKDVTLAFNNVGSEGCGILAEHLRYSQYVRNLDLTLNPICCDGFAKLVTSLDDNTFLRGVWVQNSLSMSIFETTGFNSKDEMETVWLELRQELGHKLSLNRAGRGFVATKAAILPHLLQKASWEYGSNGIFYQLQKHCSLLISE